MQPFGDERVLPESSGGNGDVSVDNTGKNGTATLIPGGKNNPDSAETTVSTGGKFEGTIGSLELGDTVKLGNSNTATINGTGGNVTMSGNSTVTVNNAGGLGSGDIAVTVNGVTVNVPPDATNIVVTNK